jgi:N6-L-threonylcarbamoyladenine synthase
MEAHVVSNLIEEPKPGFPYLNLTVSGGHTQLVLVNGPIDYRVLGETLDDAAGEAFDKVAKMLGLGYPGGPAVDRMARGGDSEFIRFPRPYLEERSFDFSFSGLKTSVLYALRRIDFEKKREELKEEQPESYRKLLSDFCASFQTCVVEVLVEKTFRAAKAKNVRSVAVAGGVGANSELRRKMRERAESEKINLFFPRMEFCTDNGAMVAMSGYLKLKAGQRSDIELAAEPNLELARSSSS